MVAKEKKNGNTIKFFVKFRIVPFQNYENFGNLRRYCSKQIANLETSGILKFKMRGHLYAKKLCYLKSSRIYSFKAEIFGQNLKYKQHDRVI